MPNNPFRFDRPPDSLLRRAALVAARPLLSWLLQLETFAGLYERLDRGCADTFADDALQALSIDSSCLAGDLARIPHEGPLIVAANHPHGALDGLVLASALRRVRNDVRLLANHLLDRIPEMRETCFFVDPFHGPEAAARSRAGLRSAHLWLKRGGALVIFPAGEVAHRRNRDGTPVEPVWPDLVGRLAQHTGARVTPAFIAGANSTLFYAAGTLHPALRTALLPRELLNKRGCRIVVRLGDTMPPPAADSGAEGAREATHRIHAEVERLQISGAVGPVRGDAGETLAAEIARLPDERLLVESSAFQVFCAPAAEIPLVLRELGRLRTIAYRAVGEGSNRTLDLDVFDSHYLHLFSWDGAARKIAGAYRIGLVDRILAERGVDGLYSRTLFRYDRRFIDRMSPALELGRSFVRLEYQRSHAALLLLWKGIGRFVARHPEYRVLIGPVSISTRYSDASHAMLKAFLEQNHYDRSLAELVDALHPLVPHAPAGVTPVLPETIDEADRLISQIEADGKGMPVLLRQYLKLNARLIGFNVDPDFGDAVDALMMVDLAAVDRAILSRYLGRDDAVRFLAHHRISNAA